MHLGFIIVLIGPSRSGKSYLLERIFHGSIIDRLREMTDTGKRQEFSLSDIPRSGAFAIDEISTFDPLSLFNGVIELAKRGRRFALTAQDLRDVGEANIARALMERRVLVVSLKSR